MRLFIWLCREAFDLSRQHKIDVMNGTPIDVKLQSNAASKVANNELTITIQQTIDSLYANNWHILFKILDEFLKQNFITLTSLKQTG